MVIFFNSFACQFKCYLMKTLIDCSGLFRDLSGISVNIQLSHMLQLCRSRMVSFIVLFFLEIGSMWGGGMC